MRRISSQLNIDEMALDESSMELELIKLQANYRHLSDYYDSYKEETQRNIKKQNNTICELLEERDILERVLGNASKSDKITKEKKRARLTELFEGIQTIHEEIMTELELMRKDDVKLTEVEDQLFKKRVEMGGIHGPLEHRLKLMKRRDYLERRENVMAQEFNKTLAANHELRDKINHIRSERAVFKQLYQRVVHELHVCKKHKADVLQAAAQAIEHRQEALTKINVHKERDEKEQVVFNQSMKVLERLMAHEKKMNEFMSIKCNDRTEFKLEECERLEREVRETLEADMQTLNQYKESYDSIKEVAELDNVDEIIARFLQQEAENFALFNYVTELNGEIEARQEEVNSVQQNIQTTQDEQQQTIAAAEHELETLVAEHSQLKEDVAKTQTKLAEVNAVLEELQALICDTFERLGCSQKTLEDLLGLNVPINVNNMIVYLGQIEQKANELLNIKHYVNLKESERTGMLPTRIDVTSFVQKQLPELQLQIPSLQEKDHEPDETVISPLEKEELKQAASASIEQRERDYIERMLRLSAHK